MPHIILEHSSNILEKDNFSDFFSDAHDMLVEKISANINACKSRAISCNNYYICDGNINNSFIHITLKIMPGRTKEQKEEVSVSLFNLLKSFFKRSLEDQNLQISVEIVDLAFYKK